MKFINKQLALKLKNKGFDRPCFGWYYVETPTGMNEEELVLNRYPCRNVTYEDTLKKHIGFINSNIVDAPTIEQVLEWLREEKNIYINVNALPSLNKNFIIKQDNHLIFDVRVYYFKEDVFKCYLDEPYFKYEDACIAGIEYIVNNLL